MIVKVYLVEFEIIYYFSRTQVKKVKSKSDDDKCMNDRMKLNPFQKYYEEKIVNSDKNKFIKSLWNKFDYR